MAIQQLPASTGSAVALPPNAVTKLARGYTSTGSYTHPSAITTSGAIVNVDANLSSVFVYSASDNNTSGLITKAYGDTSFRLTTTENNFSVFPLVPTVRLSTLNPYYPTALAYGNGVWFCTDLFGDILSSTDGITWTLRADYTGQEGKFAVYASDQTTCKYMAGGHGGTLYSSTNGTTWTTRTAASGAAQDMKGLTYGNSLYLLCGAGGRIDSSTDGVTWTTRTSGVASQLNAVAYGSAATEKYVAVGVSGVIRSSTNGVTWTSRTAGTGTVEWRSVAYGKGVYVTVGTSSTYATSTDGITWTSSLAPIATGNVILSVTFGSGLFLAPVSNNTKTMLVSLDGLNWSTTPYPNTDTSYHGQYALAAGGKVIGTTSTNGTFIAQDQAVVSLYTTELTTL